MIDNIGYIQQTMKYLLIIAVALLVLFVILLVINYTLTPISFLSFISTVKKDEPIQEEVPNKGDTFGLNAPLASDTVLDIKLEDYKPNNFTLGFDCYISRNYKSIDVPRVLFYFGGDSPITIARNSDLRETTITDASNNGLDKQPSILTDENSDIPSKFDKTNFIIYVDPIRNDIKIALFLDGITNVGPIISSGPPRAMNNKYVEVLPAIKNVPIEQPFKITFILGDTFAEVYKDKQLLFTHKVGSILKKEYPTVTTFTYAPVPNFNDRTPLTEAPHLYSPISFIGNTVRVGNVQFFNSKLDSKYVRSLMNDTLKPEFFKRI